MKKIVVAGHACLDLTPAFADSTPRPLSEVLQPGKLLEMDGVTLAAGGCVSNTGLGLKKLGAEVDLMAKVGSDEFGGLLRQLYAAHGADGALIVSPQSRTSYSVVLAAPGVDRIFLHDAGANDTFCLEDLNFEKIGEAGLFHFGYPPLMKKMYEEEGEELVRIFAKVRSLGVPTSLDLAMVSPQSLAGRANWKRILQRVLPLVDCFVPSIEELCFMLDAPRYEEWQNRAKGGDVTQVLDVQRDIRPVAQQALALGAKVVLVKCGAPGMYLCTAAEPDLLEVGRRLFGTETGLCSQQRSGASAGQFVQQWAGQDCFEKSFRPEKVLSGTGAGDTSIAAFLKALTEGCSPAECLQLATATGACCVSAYDALGGLQSFEQLRRRIATGWPKNEG